MSAMVTPNLSLREIERVIAENETTVFAPGIYCFDRPLCLEGLEHRRIIGENGAQLCGARREQVEWKPLGGELYAAQLAPGLEVDGLRAGDLTFHPARYPHASQPDAIMAGGAADALDFAARCEHPEDGAFHVMHLCFWGSLHFRITGRDEQGQLTLEGGWQHNQQMGLHPEHRYVEGLREALGAPGEFYYDRRSGELFVCCKDAPAQEVYLIHNPYLFRLRGCQDIRLENLTLQDTARTFMADFEPLLRSDWSIHRGAAIFAEDCRQIAVHGCEMRRIGSNAVFFSGNVSDGSVTQCFLHDLGASGVCFVGKPSSVSFPCTGVNEPPFRPEDLTGKGPKDDQYVRDCVVEDCLMRDFGLVEKQVAGVEISMSARIRVSHCTIHTCPRSAINLSEGTFGGHIIEHNDLFDTVRETGDHGSINGWGRDRYWRAEGMSEETMKAIVLLDAVETTVIRANRLRCDRGWDIDLDDGCSNYLLEDNLCLTGGIKFREGFHRVARRNRLINNTFHPHVWFGNSGDIFEDNLVMRPYLPIGMPERWGDRIDHNLLAALGDAARPATELQQQSGQDEHSIAAPVAFDDQLRPLDDRFPANEPYGVRCEALKAHAAQVLIDPPAPLPAWEDGRRWQLGDMLIKGIDNDGEMSAFATPGHQGVILLGLAPHCQWYRDGLRGSLVLLTLNGTPIQSAEHFIELYEALAHGAEIVLGTRNMFGKAKEYRTIK